MSDVKRYAAHLDLISLFDPNDLDEDEIAVVPASDYDALAQRCRELEAERDEAIMDGSAVLEQLDAAEHERDTLRTEVERLLNSMREVRAMFPFRIDKQAFVVNGGAPLRADGDDEFYSAAKVNSAFGKIREIIDAAIEASH